jgi:hypothetical protein
MNSDNQINEPFLFNPLKHHIGFIREFTVNETDDTRNDFQDCIRKLKHLGTSVMDVYAGSLTHIAGLAYKSREKAVNNPIFINNL